MTQNIQHATQYPWTTSGANDQTIYGNSHLPPGQPRGVVLIAHGLKSYKDYGFQPALAQHMANAGWIAHRFNFSHSGMTNDISTFARPDLFEKDTWNKQVQDVQRVAQAVQRGALPGATAGNELPQIWLGHSRGGNTTILASGRAFAQNWSVQPKGVVTLAAGSTSCRLTDLQKQDMHQDGYIEMLSSRTGQVLRQGEAWLSEQEADPDAHNLLKAVQTITCPLLLVHGQLDETVPHDDAILLKQAAEKSPQANASLVSMPGTNHTFNAPNPLPLDAPVPEITQAMFEHIQLFIETIA